MAEPFDILREDVREQVGRPTFLEEKIEPMEDEREVLIPQAGGRMLEDEEVIDETLGENKPQQIQKAQVSAPKAPEDTKQIEYVPIQALNSYQRDWKIQARVYQKTDKRQTKNGGSILKMELIDNLGTQIEAVAFGDAADYWDDKIQ